MYLPSTSKSANKADGVSNAIDQLTTTRHGQINMVCSLDMVSGFWVVEMTERSKSISAFITPSGLFEWLMMSLGLQMRR